MVAKFSPGLQVIEVRGSWVFRAWWVHGLRPEIAQRNNSGHCAGASATGICGSLMFGDVRCAVHVEIMDLRMERSAHLACRSRRNRSIWGSCR